MPRRIRLQKSSATVSDNNTYGAYRLRIDVIAVEGADTPTRIFIYRRATNSPHQAGEVDYFEAVAGPQQIAAMPETTPNPNNNWPYFRLNYIELDVMSAAQADMIWAEVQAQTAQLVKAMDKLDLLEVNQTVWVS